MKKISLKDLAGRLGNRKAAQVIGVDTATVWRWLDNKRDIQIEMAGRKPVAIIHRHPIPTHHPAR